MTHLNIFPRILQLNSPAPIWGCDITIYTNPRNCTALSRALIPDCITAQKPAGLLFHLFFFPETAKG